MASPAPAKRPSRRTKPIEGNDLLYHFFQKTLLDEDAEQFQSLTTRLVVSLGVWLPLEAYRRYPLLVPYAVRDPKCRKGQGRDDEWGSPNAAGYFRDDNSLVKGIPRSLLVNNPSNRLMHGRKLGNSFVAAHVWRMLIDGSEAPRNPLTYSFLPNLVWLPSQLAKLSDREGSFVQTLLQAISRKIYFNAELSSGLTEFADAAWSLLPERAPLEVPLPDLAALNFFHFDEAWLQRRLKTLKLVASALGNVAHGISLTEKVISSRYGGGLVKVDTSTAAALGAELSRYLVAASEPGI